ncbi:hypothetical protein C2845_PM03G09860 [Panicum miliaceum]|uniref:Ubiquitin-like protease family profile domain-containing protein n=1 Tax=Panicum miliaceum TaxID=4540 RepID=A0A3L6T3U0_PANMI|nr:hypothetical protein C2845_PM03G09860 [Panicum miliaceum]
MNDCMNSYEKLQKFNIDSMDLKINIIAALVAAGRASEVQTAMKAQKVDLTTRSLRDTHSFELAYNFACSLIEDKKYSEAKEQLDLAKSAESDGVSIEDVQYSQLPSVNESDIYHSISKNEYLSDASYHSDDSSFNHALFEQVMRDAFNKGKSDSSKGRQCLGGCLYYLAVIYLDHFDFRQRQVSDVIPRLSVRKDDMIKFYSDLDMKSHSVYGYRLILDYDSTCYAKFSLYKNIDPIVKLDADFCDKMDQASGCKLPFSLKVNILKLIDRHSFNSGLTVNMDWTSLANIAAEIKKVFAKLLNHVYDVDHRTRDLAIDLMKTIAEAGPGEAEDLSPQSRYSQPNNPSPVDCNMEKRSTSPSAPDDAVHPIGTCGFINKASPSFNPSKTIKPNTIDVDKIMKKISNSVAANVSTSNPLSDISNVVKNASSSLKRGAVKISNGVENDVIPIEVKSPEVQITGSRSLGDNISDMVKKSELSYNAQMDKVGIVKSAFGPEPKIQAYPTQSSLDSDFAGNRLDFKVGNSSTGGKAPVHGPRRAVFPSRYLGDDFAIERNKYHVTKSKLLNSKAICSLASSKSRGEDAIQFDGVRCTFWSLGELLKQGGFVNNFVIAAFCYHLFCKFNGHPDTSKRHYFFANVVLYFPTFYENHWSLFIVNIKDSKFVFLDSYFRKDDDYQVNMREQLIPSFIFWWDKYVGIDKGFDDYDVLYPCVPQQSADNEYVIS